MPDDLGSPAPALDLENLLPHRPPMRLVEAVLERAADSIRCRGAVPADSPLVRAGRATVMLGLELAAQSAALLEALARQDREGGRGEPRRGYLISLQEVHLEAPTLPAGEPLEATVTFAGGAGPLARYQARVTGAGGSPLYAEGVLGTYALPVEAKDG